MNNDNKSKNKISFSIFLTSILTFFLLWIFLAEPVSDLYVKNINKSDINIFNSKKQDLDLTKFWKAYFLLKERHYSLEWIKKQDLVDWAIIWMINAIWDDYSHYMTKEEALSFNEILSWNFEWIWAVVEKNPFWVKIDRILKGSPAKKYWLLKNDIIIEANWNKLEWLSIWEAVEKIKWPSWTKVILKILRVWEKKIIKKEVIRSRIKIPTVEVREFKDKENIWYIAINIFWKQSSLELKKALEKFKNKDWIIIDLRDNWGWYLTSAIEILSNFVENWEKLVEVRWRNIMEYKVYRSAWFWDKYTWKIVVLINWNSASASEITAWALKDHKKAIIVWTRSYGKWSVQEPFMFSDWSQLKFTVAKWFTPNWSKIEKYWIEPDIKIDLKKQDYNLKECIRIWKCYKNMKQKDFEFYDRQLIKAKEVLKSFINLWNIDSVISNFSKLEITEISDK